MIQTPESTPMDSFDLTARFSNVTTLETLLDVVVVYAQPLGADTVALFTVETTGEIVTLRKVLQWGSDLGIAEEPFTADLFSTGQALVYDADITQVMIPLQVSQTPLGLLNIGWSSLHSLDDQMRRFFTAMGQQAAWVLYGITLHAEIIQRSQRAELLRQIRENLTQATDEQAILTAIADVIKRYRPNTLTLIYIDVASVEMPSTVTVMARWMRAKNSPLPKQIRFGAARTMPEFLKAYISATPLQAPILVSHMADLTQGHDPSQVERTGFDGYSTALIPFVRREWQGILVISWAQPHTFSDEEEYVYASLIQILAPIIASRRAYLAQEAAQRETEQRAKELETVSKVSAAASRNLELDHLLQTVVDLSQTSFNLYNAHLYLIAEDTPYLVMVATSGDAGRELKALGETRLLLQRDPSLAARTGRAKEGIVVNDVTSSPEFVPNPLLPDVRSEMAVPMILGETLIGVLHLQSTEINRFTPNVLLVMQALADEIAVAVRNAQLFEEQVHVAQELRTIDRLKSQFLAHMSHELRTPLNAILNFTYFVSSGLFGDVNAKQVDALGKVTYAATHLLGLINDILDFSKIEAGMMQLFWQEVDFGALIENVVATANGLPHSEQVQLITYIDPALPVIRGDKQRLRQIFLNLLSNALKFTVSGSVTLHVNCQPDNILIKVSDTGPGIAPEDQITIFEPFRQTHEGLGQGGTGLGLPISKHLAEAHGGKLWVESELGLGSVFYVTLPTSMESNE